MKRQILLTLLFLLFLLFDLTVNSVDSHSNSTHVVLSQQSDLDTGSTLQMAYSQAIGQQNAVYHFQPNAMGYSARNPAHNFGVRVSKDFIMITTVNDTWRLEAESSSREISLEGNHLTIHRRGYDEWYVNGPLGLQQGFTLYQPSDIAFNVRGTLATTAHSQTLQIGDALTFSGLIAYDSTGQDIPVEFDIEDNRLAYVYDDAGATYPLTIDPWVQQAKLLASDGAADDWYGYSVAVDGNTAIVGSYLDDAKGSASGSAYVFVRNSGVWTQQAKLTASDGAGGDQFGRAVAVDGNTAVIGARYDDVAGMVDSGSAYVFVRNSGVWTQQAKLVSLDLFTADYFGESVDVSGDTALVGAPQDDDLGSASGSAYVFVRSGTTWSQQGKLLPPDTLCCAEFGRAVALDGNTALIGRWEDDDNGSWSGSAHVFVRSGSLWSHQAKLLPSDGAAFDHFGHSVALSGNSALIGAYENDDNGTDSGSAYVFVRSSGVWTQQAKLLPNDGAAEDEFGYSVALSGNRALVGARLNDVNGYNSGSAYAYRRSGTVWTQQDRLLANDGAANDYFGQAVALDGTTALVGAYLNDDKGTDSGSAYAFVFATPPAATAFCNGPNLQVTIAGGDGPFNITASAGINTPIYGVGVGTTTINGPEKWDNLTVHETSGDFASNNLGQFKCRTDDRPTLYWPNHQAHTTNRHPTFIWSAIIDANNYRLFLFDDKVAANRTVDIRENSGGATTYVVQAQLPIGRVFWRVRARVNRVWGLWSGRFTLFIDPVVIAPAVNSVVPVPTLNLSTPLPPNSPPDSGTPPTSEAPPATELPQPPNSR